MLVVLQSYPRLFGRAKVQIITNKSTIDWIIFLEVEVNSYHIIHIVSSYRFILINLSMNYEFLSMNS